MTGLSDRESLLMRRRILFFTPGFPGPGRVQLTGGLISNFHFCRALREEFDVTVLTVDDQLDPGDYQHEGLTYIVRRPPQMTSRLRRASEIRKFLRSTFEDYVQQHSAPDIALFTAATIPFCLNAAWQDCPRVIITRAFEDFGFSSCGLPSLERIRYGWSYIRRVPGTAEAYERAACVITNSDFMSGCIRQQFKVKRIEVLHPCIDRELFTANINGDPPAKTIGFVSRNSGKNLGFILRLAKRLSEFTFYVFGPCSVARLPPNVIACGWESDRNRMFAQAAQWIVPSLWQEPFGRVAAEALAAKRMVLVSDKGGLPEAVGYDQQFIVNSLEEEEWARRIVDQSEYVSEICMPDCFGEAIHDRKALEYMQALCD